ncbi:ABC transporter substrate binding protein [Thaumasiovibrio subtropicus]|uniref:ABC transporter substrate binding protein n=1 Tax=Thaumasiovibrio subtropicus TaxID=1891207 RepID=UPI000B34B426|nr:ABC transporter substrate binding protein [Thaumasiovibrio subtropicus]
MASLIRLIILVVVMVSSCRLVYAAWPDWLGDDVQREIAAEWQYELEEGAVLVSPSHSRPQIWAIISRKAKSYDIAISTMLNVYKRELDDAIFHLYLLPDDEAGLNTLLAKAEQNADLIYTVGSKATVAVHQHYSKGSVPVVSVNAKDPVQMGLIDSYEGSGEHFAFTSLNLPADVTLSFLTRFKPSLSSLGILYAKQNTSAYLTQFLPLKAEAEKQGIAVYEFVIDDEDPELALQQVMAQQLKAMKERDPTQSNSLLWLTGSSRLLAQVAEINQLAGDLPLLTVVPEAVSGAEDSALMSVGVSFVNNAHQAALYGIHIVRDGADPATMPVGVLSPPDISISFRQAKRIGSKVPFTLIEMASDIYAEDGRVIRAQGLSMEGQ